MDIHKLNSDKVRKEYCEEIRLFIEYGVTESERQTAFDTLRTYEANSMALVVLRDFYSRLPELREEAVCKISRIVSRKGMYLLGVDTLKYQYLYFFNGEQPIYIGERSHGIADSEVLQFFGYASNEDFLKRLDGEGEGESAETDADVGFDQEVFCPACGVAQGELHELGCPVEICPWCDGQLNYCNCRFEKLGVDEIVDEAEIDRLEILLNEKGRIPFSAQHAPAYPSAGDDD